MSRKENDSLFFGEPTCRQSLLEIHVAYATAGRRPEAKPNAQTKTATRSRPAKMVERARVSFLAEPAYAGGAVGVTPTLALPPANEVVGAAPVGMDVIALLVPLTGVTGVITDSEVVEAGGAGGTTIVVEPGMMIDTRYPGGTPVFMAAGTGEDKATKTDGELTNPPPIEDKILAGIPLVGTIEGIAKETLVLTDREDGTDALEVWDDAKEDSIDSVIPPGPRAGPETLLPREAVEVPSPDDVDGTDELAATGVNDNATVLEYMVEVVDLLDATALPVLFASTAVREDTLVDKSTGTVVKLKVIVELDAGLETAELALDGTRHSLVEDVPECMLEVVLASIVIVLDAVLMTVDGAGEELLDKAALEVTKLAVEELCRKDTGAVPNDEVVAGAGMVEGTEVMLVVISLVYDEVKHASARLAFYSIQIASTSNTSQQQAHYNMQPILVGAALLSMAVVSVLGATTPAKGTKVVHVHVYDDGSYLSSSDAYHNDKEIFIKENGFEIELDSNDWSDVKSFMEQKLSSTIKPTVKPTVSPISKVHRRADSVTVTVTSIPDWCTTTAAFVATPPAVTTTATYQTTVCDKGSCETSTMMSTIVSSMASSPSSAPPAPSGSASGSQAPPMTTTASEITSTSETAVNPPVSSTSEIIVNPPVSSTQETVTASSTSSAMTSASSSSVAHTATSASGSTSPGPSTTSALPTSGASAGIKSMFGVAFTVAFGVAAFLMV
ncbi:hypothetical protein B0A49_01534 [Cryomyces minteri]|uniref:Uncharacterized protein n=1 Tax=Cryomyces minteri TaxID=331657 RepID=A0A4U0XPG1_9PEZI|nr:hypothetical protein B0A49_01534 [Cryomyces minteri]